MTVNFHKIQLPVKPDEYPLTKLPTIRGLTRTPQPEIGNPETRATRDLDRISADIEEGNSEGITSLEWIYYLYAQTQRETHPNLSPEIWQTALTNDWLKRYLLWRLALQFSQDLETNRIKTAKILPDSLINAFAEFETRLSQTDRLPLQLLRILPEPEAENEIANLCWQNLQTPIELMEKAKLPTEIPAVQSAFAGMTTSIFSRDRGISQSEVKWVLRCLQQMSSQQQLIAVEDLLAKLSGELKDGLPKLIEWIKTEYQGQESLLSEAANAHLKRWVAQLNYSYFQQVANLVATRLSLPESEIQSVEDCRDFWANYSDRLQNIRILLPKSSLEKLKYQLPLEVDALTPDGSDSTEVSILDFNKNLVVEFWRGLESEARVLPKTARNEKLLFGAKSLSVKNLRKLEGKACDRALYWQPYCEKLLKAHRILPNANIEYFQGLPKDRGKYHRSTGLPLPSDREQKQRESALKQKRR